MRRKLNFYAGPAILPEEVLKELQENMAEFQNEGLSLIEASHRGALYDGVHNETVDLFRELMGIPENYSVLFLGGGATLQFAMLPMNLLSEGKTAEYIHSGAWAGKAIDDAQKIGKVRVLFDGKDSSYTTLPEAGTVRPSDDAAYLHITSNETIGGVQWKAWPDTGEVPLVADMSSDILSRPLPIEKFGVIYAGAQKNLGPAGTTIVIMRNDLWQNVPDSIPAYLNYKIHAKKNSLYNTPPVFSIWATNLVLKWVRKMGGAEAMQKRAQQKAELIYKVINESNGFYHCPVDTKCRSNMNIVFRLHNEEAEALFLKDSAEKGMLGLKGHRSVGGCRASLYNSQPIEAVESLAEYMKSFAKAH